MLVLTRKKQQSVLLGGEIEVRVLEIAGDSIRLGITAPRHLKILRKELMDEVAAENQAAAMPCTVNKLSRTLKK